MHRTNIFYLKYYVKMLQAQTWKRYDLTTNGTVKLFGILSKMQANSYIVLVKHMLSCDFAHFRGISRQFLDNFCNLMVSV